MSFLSKLFRGMNQRSEPAHTEEPPPAPPELPTAVESVPTARAPETEPEAAPETEPEATPENAPPAEEERPWWEVSVPSPAAVEVEPINEQTAVEGEAIEAQPEPNPIPNEDNAIESQSEGTVADEAERTSTTAVLAEEPEATAALEAELSDGTRQLTEHASPELVALRSRRNLAAAAQRDIGRVRSINQDSVFCFLTTLPRENSDVTLGLFIVADGMGGHDGGEIASRLAVTTVAQHVLSDLVLPALTDTFNDTIQPLLISAVQEANRTIWEQAQLAGSDMGTTCTVALLLGQAFYIAHVGDSRAYLVTPTGMRLLTTDHSAVGRLIQVGQLDPEEARDHPLRSQLYRTIGQNPEVIVDFMYQPIGDGTHLLLCSDGLWGMLDDEVLLDVLEHALWPQDACRELIARANLAGGEDNISAVVVTLPTQ